MICIADLYIEFKKYERFKNRQEKREQNHAAIKNLKKWNLKLVLQFTHQKNQV